MAIVPNKTSNTTIITGDGVSLDELPINEVPYRDSNGVIRGSGLRILQAGTLLAPVGFAVESGSVDFGDVLRLSESAGFLAFENMIDQKKYQLLDYAVPRNAPSSKPFYFYLIEAEQRRVGYAGSGKTITTNPLSFEYTTKLTARSNALIFNASAPMSNVRLRVSDKESGVALKYYPSKSSWETGTNGTTFDVGENILDLEDTALIFEANTDIIFDIQADSVYLVGDTIPWFGAYSQQGVFIGVADANDLADIKSEIQELSDGFSGNYSDLNGIPSTFPPSAHTHEISDVVGLTIEIEELESGIDKVSSSLESLATVASTGSYVDLINKPASITAVSQLNNDLEFVTIEHTHPVSDIVGLQDSLDSKLNKSANISASQVNGLATVATTGSYNDLGNKPTFPTNISSLTNDVGYITLSQVPSISVSWSDIQGKPVTFAPSTHTHPISDIVNLQSTLDGKMPNNAVFSYNSLIDKPTLFSGSYNDLTNKPVLFSGSYADLINKPVFATVASTGSYNDLTNKPAIPVVSYPVTSVAGKIGSVALTASDITGLANIATSGNYSDLSNKPTIPPAQVQSDWNQTLSTSIDYIKNKPVLFSGSWNDLTNKPTTFLPSAHTHPISDITNLQSSLDSKANNTALSNYATTTSLTNAVAGLRKVETFLGTTDASGNLTITFANTYVTAPDVQPQIVGGTFNQFVRIVSVSTTNAVLQVAQRNTVALLGIEVLLGATVVQQGVTVTCQVTPRI